MKTILLCDICGIWVNQKDGSMEAKKNDEGDSCLDCDCDGTFVIYTKENNWTGLL